MRKQNIIFQQDWADHILTWDRETAYEFMIAVLEYGFYETEHSFDKQQIQRIYEAVKDTLDENKQAYQAKVESARRARDERSKKSVLKSELKSDVKPVLKSELKSRSIDIDIDIDNNNNVYMSEQVGQVVSYLNQKTNSSFKPTTAETKKHITARLKEGYTVDDFKLVIDHKTEEWSGSDKMRQYLRPSTLFAPSKFEAYLQEAKKPKAVKKNDFSNHPQNTYDFAELEKKLISN